MRWRRVLSDAGAPGPGAGGWGPFAAVWARRGPGPGWRPRRARRALLGLGEGFVGVDCVVLDDALATEQAQDARLGDLQDVGDVAVGETGQRMDVNPVQTERVEVGIGECLKICVFERNGVFLTERTRHGQTNDKRKEQDCNSEGASRSADRLQRRNRGTDWSRGLAAAADGRPARPVPFTALPLSLVSAHPSERSA